MNKVGRAIRRAIKASGLSAREINHGRCWWLAYCVKVEVRGAKVVETREHSFVGYRGKLYDAENPEGVD